MRLKPNLKNKAYLWLLPVFIVLTTVLSTPSANAQWWSGLAETITSTATYVMFGWALVLIKGILTYLVSFLGSGINAVLSIRIETSGVVRDSWDLVRGFSNMFFILSLVIMSFATIFNVSQYDFRRIFVRLLIAALFVNFSLVICSIIIDWTQSISNIFLGAIGDVGSRLAGNLSLGGNITYTPPSGAVITDIQLWEGFMRTSVDIIFLSIILFSLGILFITTLIRIPILWGLMIIAPIAWVAYILPTTQNINRMWWRNFIGWNIFLPIYLFFIYFATYLLQNRAGILGSTPAVSILGLSFETVFFYIFVAMVLIGGAKFAMSSSMAAGAGAVTAGVWARGRAASYSGWRGTGIPGYWQARTKQAREEGYKIPFTQTRVFGEQQRKEAEAGLGNVFGGVRGSNLQQQREFITKTEREFKNLQDQFDIRKIDEKAVKEAAGFDSATNKWKSSVQANNPQVYANRKMLAKLGLLDKDVYSQTLKELSKNPLAAQDFAKIAKESKYSSVKGSELVEMTTGIDKDGNAVYTDLDMGELIPAKKEQVKFIQGDELLRSSLTQEQFDRMVGIFGGSTTLEGKNFMKDVSENRPDLSIEYALAHDQDRNSTIDRLKVSRTDASGSARGVDAINSEIRLRSYQGVVSSSEDNLAKMPYEFVWKYPEFQQALEERIKKGPSDKIRTRFVSNLLVKIQQIKDPRDKSRKYAALSRMVKNLRKQGINFTDAGLLK